MTPAKGFSSALLAFGLSMHAGLSFQLPSPVLAPRKSPILLFRRLPSLPPQLHHSLTVLVSTTKLSALDDASTKSSPKINHNPSHETTDKTEDCCPPTTATSDSSSPDTATTEGPEPLKPFLPALDPKYPTHGPIGLNSFRISRTGPPTPQELTNEQMLQIVTLQCSDLEVNTLVWKCLGYRFNEETESWDATEVFPKWKEKYPTPPDFIGMKRVYEREVDQVSLRANQALVRSIPVDNKQSLKTHLKPSGWKGYQYKELTPNKTRRAQCANWLIFYREELFGCTVDELRERRRLKKESEEVASAALREKKDEKDIDKWKPPVKEVF